MTGSARREAPYNLRMSLVDRRAFEAAAAAENVTLAEFLRRAAREAAQRRLAKLTGPTTR